MSAYLDELTKSMTLLGEQPNALFLGQSVAVPGTPMYPTFAGVKDEQKIEFPVAENLQMGVATGLALEGFLPVSIFPRMNFMLYAMDQLVNHLDRLPLYSGYRPKVIIRTAVGRSQPLDPGPQHQDDFTETLVGMFQSIYVNEIRRPDQAVDMYRAAVVHRDGATLIVEHGNKY